MDPAEALQALENSLRLIVREVLGADLPAQLSNVDKLARNQARDLQRRDGALVSDDLLAYTEFPELRTIISNNWPRFEPVFSDQQRIEVYLEAVERVRNAIAHSRQLLEFEKDLVSGISGQLRNQITIYRTRTEPATAHYPVIESVQDSFGQRGRDPDGVAPTVLRRGWITQRLEVGDTVSFDCHGSDERGRELEWFLQAVGRSFAPLEPSTVTTTGSTAVLRWNVTDEDVGEERWVAVAMRSLGARYHRRTDALKTAYDDKRAFLYAVNPPRD
jgi:hypothetical protein